MTVVVEQNLVTTDSIVLAKEDQVSAELVGEAVILNLESGVYYGLNPVGTDVWQFIQSPQPVSAVCSRIVEEYDVEAGRCKQDVLKLLNDMASKGLIEVTTKHNG
jgi:hypothetical protein